MMNKIILFNLSNRVIIVSIGKIFAFITVPFITRILGPEKYGTYNYIIAIASYGALLADWGFLAKGVRDVAKCGHDSAHIVIIISQE